ncbi:hypothetical protein CMO83_01145 [Candidatus Woesearchaeota archaeon]|jgi:hypothetical protein|nr:hypothetical protein [Candidatus Woesearchaeota archaeon]MDP6648472.1 hypothetical protein [Candidatus Woesearchaeota archaeon]|tara:strand:+ start:26081 stop:26329 length:249 start_codon:yes stop_codon:yes gene_type:complete
MNQEYNWNLILKVSIPISIIVGYFFYIDISKGLRWTALITGLIITGAIIYFKDKKKNNIFNAIAIVVLIALIVRFLNRIGII